MMVTERDFLEMEALLWLIKREISKWKCHKKLVVYLMLYGNRHTRAVDGPEFFSPAGRISDRPGSLFAVVKKNRSNLENVILYR